MWIASEACGRAVAGQPNCRSQDGKNWHIPPHLSTYTRPIFTPYQLFSIGRPLYEDYTSGSAMAEGPRDALVSRNSATTKYPYRMALFA